MNSKRNIISVFLLAVYSIVLAHNFVPHEHHSNINDCRDKCNTHIEIVAQKCCTSIHDHGQNSHQQIHCHFEVKLVLSHLLNISDFYNESETLEIIQTEPESRLISYFEYSQKLPDPHCRDVSLRAPPVSL